VPAELTAATPAAIAEAITLAVPVILGLQEGEARAEWPYEGVYRVRGQIPIGYRVGGTGIAAVALMRAPGFADDAARRDAVGRAARFVCASTAHPLMSHETYAGGYDVRGWGYTYGLWFLLEAQAAGVLPDDLAQPARDATAFYLRAIAQTEIPGVGGWSYSRAPGRDRPGPASPFMTAPTLQVLFEARRRGHEVDAAIIERGLAVLERGRTGSGAVSYAVGPERPGRDLTPGAVGRMLATECTLFLAGRSSQATVRGALDAFLTHWGWLEARRAKPGTHEGPYAIAPYYFFYAHYYAAQAIELLPEPERAEYRRRLAQLILAVRAEDGSFNDRVFPRTAGYGTAMALMSLAMQDAPAPARWEALAPDRPDTSQPAPTE